MILEPKEQRRRMLLRLKGIEGGRALIGPAIVSLHVTDLCNAACRYCWHYAPGSPHKPAGHNHLPFEVFEKVAEDCEGLKADEFYISGVGDPIFHPRFYDMLKVLEPVFNVTVFSNATFPIERCPDILRADRIIINLSESDPEGYRRTYGRDLFARVIKNIRELNRLRAKLNPDFFIEVVIVVTRLNAQTQFKTEKLVRKLGADRVERKKFYMSPHTQELMLPGQEEIKAMEGAWPPCYHGWFYSHMTLEGDVTVCPFMHRWKMGNVYTARFKDIWESQEYTRVRSMALNGDTFRDYHECINCNAARRNKLIGAQFQRYANLVKT